LRSCAQRLAHVILALRYGEHDHLHEGTGMRDRTSSLQAAARHADIEKNDIGSLILCDANCIFRTSTLCHDLPNLPVPDGMGDTLPEERMIIDDRYADGWAWSCLP
jgi:hypothetical protein